MVAMSKPVTVNIFLKNEKKTSLHRLHASFFFRSLFQVTWLSKWDGLLAGTKYMMLAASSSFKGKSDVRKYDKAMKLKGFIERIREDYTKKLSSGDKRTKQVRVRCLLYLRGTHRRVAVVAVAVAVGGAVRCCLLVDSLRP